MWDDQITWRHVVLAVVSAAVFVRMLSVAFDIRRGGKQTHLRLSVSIFGTCAEIALATMAVFMRRTEEWFIVRAGARLIEYAFWERFNRYLKKNGNS